MCLFCFWTILKYNSFQTFTLQKKWLQKKSLKRSISLILIPNKNVLKCHKSANGEKYFQGFLMQSSEVIKILPIKLNLLLTIMWNGQKLYKKWVRGYAGLKYLNCQLLCIQCQEWTIKLNLVNMADKSQRKVWKFALSWQPDKLNGNTTMRMVLKEKTRIKACLCRRERYASGWEDEGHSLEDTNTLILRPDRVIITDLLS